jgi:hypothetical protein
MQKTAFPMDINKWVAVNCSEAGRISIKRKKQGQQESLLSKWFCDTSTGTVTGAVHCGFFFVGWGFGLMVATYG